MKINDIFKKMKSEEVENKEQSQQLESPLAENDLQKETPAAGTLTEEQKKKNELAEKAGELNDKYLRLYSEFDNYRKRTAKERIELIKTAGEDILKFFLPVADDFERALKFNETAADLKVVNEGFNLIYNKFKATLNQKGIEQMESLGKPFDPDLHEAITNIPAPSEDMKGKVIDEVEKGYYLNGKVIRFAKVIVGN